MSDRQKAFDDLEDLLRPFVMEAAERELEGMLKSISPDRLRLMMDIVERRVSSRITKSLAMRILNRKLRKAESGDVVTLSKREEKTLFRKASKHLPRLVVSSWLNAVERWSRTSGALASSKLGPELVPKGLDDRLFDLDEDARLIGIDVGRIRGILKQAGASKRREILGPLTIWLDARGIVVT